MGCYSYNCVATMTIEANHITSLHCKTEKVQRNTGDCAGGIPIGVVALLTYSRWKRFSSRAERRSKIMALTVFKESLLSQSLFSGDDALLLVGNVLHQPLAEHMPTSPLRQSIFGSNYNREPLECYV